MKAPNEINKLFDDMIAKQNEVIEADKALIRDMREALLTNEFYADLSLIVRANKRLGIEE